MKCALAGCVAGVLSFVAACDSSAAAPSGVVSCGMGWEFHPAGAANIRASSAPNQAGTALRVTAGDRVSARSAMFDVEPNRTYRLSGRTRAKRGAGGFSFNLLWHDSAGRFLGQDFAGVVPVVTGDWETHAIELTAPAGAQRARIQFAAPPRVDCELADVTIAAIARRGPRLAIDMVCEPLSARGSQPSSLGVRIENRGDGLLTGLRGTLRLPVGLRSDDVLQFETGRLGYGESQSHAWQISGWPQRLGEAITCDISGKVGDQPVEFHAGTLPFVTAAEERITPTDRLSTPEPCPTSIRLGCYYFPVMLDWDRQGRGVRRVESLRPRLGFYDERLPQVADWHIAWALAHGVSYFVFDWYHNKGMDFLNDALEKGFLGSRFCERMQFCVDWCNEGQCNEFKLVDFQDAALESFIRTLCTRYFPHKNYLRIGGRPVVFIHVPLALANDRGGWKGCSEGLSLMRTIARRQGHPGVYFVAVQNNYPYLPDYRQGGFDAVAPYAYGFSGVPKDPQTHALPYAALMPRHYEQFETARDEAHRRGLAYIPSAWMGWNDVARSGDRAVQTSGNTPAAFRRMVEMLPRFVEPDERLALVEAWNEWGEGGQIEPELQYGFGRLSAVRDVLSEQRGTYTVPAPPAEESARLEAHVCYTDVLTDYARRYADRIGLTGAGLNMAFSSPDDLYLCPKFGIQETCVGGGRQSGVSVGSNPVLLSPPCLQLPAARVAAIEIRLKAEAGDRIRLFWKRSAEEEWSESRSVQQPLVADGQFHDYRFPLAKQAGWQGVIHQLRLAPTNRPGAFAIERFRCR